jgi:hypothetical protein
MRVVSGEHLLLPGVELPGTLFFSQNPVETITLDSPVSMKLPVFVEVEGGFDSKDLGSRKDGFEKLLILEGMKGIVVHKILQSGLRGQVVLKPLENEGFLKF